MNNRNGNIWIGGVPESDNYRAGYGLSLNPKDLMTTIKEDTRTGKTPRVLKSTIGGSVQVGTVVGVTKPEEVDKAIEDLLEYKAVISAVWAYPKAKVKMVQSL